MFSQSTRLELIIVAVALLVLFLCRQPPKSGNAGVPVDIGQTPRPDREPVTSNQRRRMPQAPIRSQPQHPITLSPNQPCRHSPG